MNKEWDCFKFQVLGESSLPSVAESEGRAVHARSL